jgi:hypothetical protein
VCDNPLAKSALTSNPFLQKLFFKKLLFFEKVDFSIDKTQAVSSKGKKNTQSSSP